MGRYVAGLGAIRVNVPESTEIEQGRFYLLEGFFGLAVRSVKTAAGQTDETALNCVPGEYETDQIDGSATYSRGDFLYWNDTTKKLVKAADAGNTLVGKVTWAEGAAVTFMMFPPMSKEEPEVIET
jgi:hypothetical protein